jgi:hypothetical protein
MALKRYFLLIVFCFTPVSLFSNKLYFPQVAFGGGYTATIILMNMGTTNVSSRFQVYSQTGALLRSVPTTLPAGGSTRISVVDDGQPIISSWGMLDAGTGMVQGVATLENRSTTGALIRTAGVLGLEAADAFTLPVDVTESGIASNTAVAMANVNPGSAVTVVLQLMSESGSGSSSATLNSARFITLGSGHQIAELVTSIWPELAIGFRGTLLVAVIDTARQPNSLVLTALSVKNGMLSAVPAIPGLQSCFGCWDY